MTKDDNPEPPKEQQTANLSEARKEELERATDALLHWMAEQIVNELVDEQRQQRAQVPETLANKNSYYLKKEAILNLKKEIGKHI